MSESVLFVGGPKDGEWMKIPRNRDTCRVLVLDPLLRGAIPSPFDPPDVTTVTYIRRRDSLFTPEGESMNETIAKLIEGYSPKREKE